MSNERRHWHQFSASCYACINFHLRGLCCTCEQPLHIATGISHANNWAWFWKNVLMVCWCFCMHDVKDRQACSFKGPVNSLWHFFFTYVKYICALCKQKIITFGEQSNATCRGDARNKTILRSSLDFLGPVFTRCNASGVMHVTSSG